MRLTEIDLRLIAKKLTNDNIELTFVPFEETVFLPYEFRINLDFLELDNISYSYKAKKGHNVREFYLIALLHEIGHYKHWLKHKGNKDFEIRYCQNKNYYEYLADRYARRYYKKVLKNYIAGLDNG